MWPALDDLIDELSFSGLNGCMAEEAWQLCRQVCPDFSTQFGRSYILHSLGNLSDIEMYYAGKQCEDISASNTFVNEGAIRGFCLDYHTRSRCHEYNDQDDVKFVVRQERREYALSKRWTSRIPTLQAAAYCLLEYIAFGRRDGVMVVGTDSNKFVVNERPCLSKLLSISAKAIFYQMEPLEALNLVSKQDCLSKTHNRSKLILHIRFEPNLNYFCDLPELKRRHCGSLIDVDILYHVFKLTEHYPQPSLEECSSQLSVSRRMLRRLLEEPIRRGDLREIRHDAIGLTIPILEAMDKELRSRADKRLLGRRKRNIDLKKTNTRHTSHFSFHRPLIHSALSLIASQGALAHSELSKKLRLDFYKARRLRNAISEMKDVEAQIDPEDAQEDHLYRIKNEVQSQPSMSTESGQQRAARRKEILLQLVRKRKATFAHRLKMDLCQIEHKAGISTAVDRKTVVGLLQTLAEEGKLRLVKPNTDETTLMVVSAEESKLPVERDNSISVRDADMIGGTIKILRDGEPVSSPSLQRCITGLYGYVAKFQRCCVLHKFIYYLLYAHEENSADPWKRHIPKPPKRVGQPSVIALGDVLLCMPLCIYANLVRIPIESRELMETLSDERASTLIHSLSENLKGQILQKRKFLFQLEATLKNLVMMGLAKFIENSSGSLEKQNLLIYIDKKAVFYEYEGSESKMQPVIFELNSMEDVESLWQYIMTSSLTDPRFCPVLRKTNRNEYDKCRALQFEPEYAEAMVPVKEVPNGYLPIPGKHDGPLGLDRRMFTWLSTNWSIYSMTQAVVKELRKRYNGALGPPVPYLCCRVTLKRRVGETPVTPVKVRSRNLSRKNKKKKTTDLLSNLCAVAIPSSNAKYAATSVDENDLKDDDGDGDSCSECDSKSKSPKASISTSTADCSTMSSSVADNHKAEITEDRGCEVLDLSTPRQETIVQSSVRDGRRRRRTREWSIEVTRVLEVLRASLLFLSVRLERFMRPNNTDRMSTHYLIGWLVGELNLHQFDPRQLRPDSNIRKLLNDDPIREAASALCLQMSLDETMQKFELNCRLSVGLRARAASNEDVEITLKEFYRKFKQQLCRYIVTGQSLVSSDIDLRKINLDEYMIVKRTSTTAESRFIGDFFVPNRRTVNPVSEHEISNHAQTIAEEKKKIRAIILCLMLSTPEERAQQAEAAYNMLKNYPEWLIEDILLTMHMDEHLIVNKKRKDITGESDKVSVGRIYELHSRFCRDFRPMPASTFSALNDRPESIRVLDDTPWVPAVLVSNLVHELSLPEQEDSGAS